MKPNWRPLQLRNVCKLISGQHIDSKDYNVEGRGIGYLTGPSDFGKLNPIVSKWTEHPKITASSGDILITVKGSGVGKINMLDQDTIAISRQLMAVRVTDAVPQFIHAVLDSSFEHFQSLATGAAIPGISRDQVLGLNIALPPHDEQQRIVAILDEAFDGIATAKANAETNLKNARAIFESHLQWVFTEQGAGWRNVAFEDAVDSACTLSYGIVQPGEEYSGGLPIVRPTDLGSKVIEVEGLKRIDPNLANSYRRTTLRGGDLLLCVRGTTGLISIASPDLAGANVTRGIVPIFFEPMVASQDFGYYLMRSNAMQSQIREKTYGTALLQINIGDLRNLKLPIPPIAEQDALTTRFNELDEETQRLESVYKQKLTALDDLKKSLLHRAFNGDL